MSTIPEFAPYPAANAVPEVSNTEYQALKDDIRANGLFEEIVLQEGLILDGRHRYRACRELGIEPRFRKYDGDERVAFVISMNLSRRRLTPGQLAVTAAVLADMKRGGDRTKAQDCALTHAKAAEMVNVSERSVDTASALLNGVNSGRIDPEVLARDPQGRDEARQIKQGGAPAQERTARGN